MAAVTLLSMRERVVRAADAEGTIDPANATDILYLNPIINSALGRLHEALTLAFEDYHLTVSSQIVVSGASVSFTLAGASITNLLKFRGLERLRSDLKYDDVDRISLAERNRRIVRGYFLASDTVFLYPGDKAAGTYRVWYTPAFTLLAADGSTYETINGWEEMAITDAAMQVKDGLEKDYSLLAQQYAKRIEDLTAIKAARSSGGPKKVRHVRWTLYDRLRSGDLDELE